MLTSHSMLASHLSYLTLYVVKGDLAILHAVACKLSIFIILIFKFKKPLAVITRNELKVIDVS